MINLSFYLKFQFLFQRKLEHKKINEYCAYFFLRNVVYFPSSTKVIKCKKRWIFFQKYSMAMACLASSKQIRFFLSFQKIHQIISHWWKSICYFPSSLIMITFGSQKQYDLILNATLKIFTLFRGLKLKISTHFQIDLFITQLEQMTINL